jgi:hypothetical protein
MNINRSNYESWFLDYHEGALSPAEAEAVLAFLKQHADLHAEFASFEQFQLEAADENMDIDKNLLHKPVIIDENNIDEWLIAELEGNLTEEELLQLHDYLHRHPNKKNDRRIYASTKLESGTENNPSSRLLYSFEPLGEHNMDVWLIAEVEGQLNLQQKTKLLDFLHAHPAYQRQREMYAMSRLDATEIETYNEKYALYKKDATVISLPAVQHGANTGASYRSLMRLAAILMLLIGGWYVFKIYLQPREERPSLAQQHPSVQWIENTEDPENDKTEWAPEPDSATNSTVLPKDTLGSTPAAEPTMKKITPGRKTDRRRKPLRHVAPKVPEVMPQQLAQLPLKGNPAIKLPETSVTTERRYTPNATPQYNNAEATPSLRSAIEQDPLASALLTPQSLQKEMGLEEEVIMAERAPARLTPGSKLLQAGAKAVSKITGNKVKVRTAFNPVTGKLSAYEVETKKRTWQKQLKSDYVSAE